MKAVISQHESRGDWTFAYLGAAPDRWTRETGMAAGSVATFSVADPQASFRVVSEATHRLRVSRRQSTRSFFAADEPSDPYIRRYYPLFLLLARTGMRVGEALALQWDDVNFRDHDIRVARAVSGTRIETPRSGHGRTVDMSDQLAKTLLRLQVERKTEILRAGLSAVPADWVFCTETGTRLDTSRIRKVMRRVLKVAGLPTHFSPHCLRHTFASILLQQGESLPMCSGDWATPRSP